MKKTIAVLCFSVLSFAAAAAHADSFTYVANGTSSNGSLSGSAVFTTSAGQLQVTLSNTLAADLFRSSGQALSDLIFTLSSGPGTLGTTSATGQLGTISTTGGVTYTSGSATRFLGAGGQGGFSISGNTITLEAIGGGQPSEMIAPYLANGGTFTNANSGLATFDPYAIGPVTFTLALSGVTSSTTVTGANFSFGTGPDTTITGTQTPTVPEPSSIALLGTALLGAAGIVRRRLV